MTPPPAVHTAVRMFRYVLGALLWLTAIGGSLLQHGDVLGALVLGGLGWLVWPKRRVPVLDPPPVAAEGA